MAQVTPEAEGRCGLRQRFFAWCFGRMSASEILPQSEECRREILSGLRGDIVEIGPGVGDNLSYFAPEVRWTGIEPNLFMHDSLQDALRESGLEGEIRTGTAERTQLPDACTDAVVSTFVLCSVSDVDTALREIRRILRPGGQFAFLEHVAAPRGTALRLAQSLIKPVWKLAADGCTPDRDIEAAIRRAGFARVEMQAFSVPEFVVSPRIAGIAIR